MARPMLLHMMRKGQPDREGHVGIAVGHWVEVCQDRKKLEMPYGLAPAAGALGFRKAAMEAVNVIRALSVPSRFAIVGVVAVAAAAVVVIADAFNVVVLAVVVVVAAAVGVADVLKALRCSDDGVVVVFR